MRHLALLVLLLGCAVPAAAANIVGTWLPDPSSAPKGAVTAGLEITFRQDGGMTIRGPQFSAEGAYKIKANTVSIVLSKRNGHTPTTPQERNGTLTIAEGGKVLLADSGMRKAGKVVMMRFIRKPKRN